MASTVRPRPDSAPARGRPPRADHPQESREGARVECIKLLRGRAEEHIGQDRYTVVGAWWIGATEKCAMSWEARRLLKGIRAGQPDATERIVEHPEYERLRPYLRDQWENPPKGRFLAWHSVVTRALVRLSEREPFELGGTHFEPQALAEVLGPRFLALMSISMGTEEPITAADGNDGWRERRDNTWGRALVRAQRKRARAR